MRQNYLSLLILLALTAINARADRDVCHDLVNCGMYGTQFKIEGRRAFVTIKISAVGSNHAHLGYVFGVDGGSANLVDLDMTFEDNGSFKMIANTASGERLNYANGICDHLTCTYEIRPDASDDSKKVVGRSGWMHFTPSGLEFKITYELPNDSKTLVQNFELIGN